jgi:protein-tyrosine phosphatase
VGRTGTVVGCWLLRQKLARPANVLDTIMELRKQDRERGQRMSPETPGQQRFVKQWPAQETSE